VGSNLAERRANLPQKITVEKCSYISTEKLYLISEKKIDEKQSV
jgi:hypothetical protein